MSDVEIQRSGIPGTGLTTDDRNLLNTQVQTAKNYAVGTADADFAGGAPGDRSSQFWSGKAQGYASQAQAVGDTMTTRYNTLNSRVDQIALKAGVVSNTAYDPMTIAFATAASNAGALISERRQRRFDRMIKRLVAAGIPTSAGPVCGLYVTGDSKAHLKINILSPGTRDLTEVGATTFTADQSAFIFGANSNNSTANYYDTGIPYNAISPTNFTMVVAIDAGPSATNSTSSASYDCGAYEGSNGVAINVRYNGAGTRARFRAHSADVEADTDTSRTYWSGTGSTGYTRTSTANFKAYHNGALLTTVTQASTAPTTTTTITLLKANGAASQTNRRLQWAYVGNALSDSQMAVLHAAVTDYLLCVTYGDPFIYETGYGPANVTADFVVTGWSTGSCEAAYELARMGYSVAVLGDEHDETIWGIGGMPSSGLDWIDLFDFACATTVYYECLSWSSKALLGYVSEPATSGRLSVEPRLINMAWRRAFDPTRTTGTQLRGVDNVKFYACGGLANVVTDGSSITALQTVDGRTVVASKGVYIEGLYNGDLVRLACPPANVQQGMEAAGTGIEAYSGWRLSNAYPLNLGGGSLNVDPYFTAGNPSSGLARGVQVPAGVTVGGPDPALQAMNLRLTIAHKDDTTGQTTVWQRAYPIGVVPPTGYNPLDYEILRRAYAACAAISFTPSITNVIQWNPLGSFSNDVNAAGNLSIDKPNSGLDYAKAGSNYASRKQVFDSVRRYEIGFIYWHAWSGEAVIPTAIRDWFRDIYADTLNHLDVPAGKDLFIPSRVYIRDPAYMLKNTFVLNADDVAMTDGTTPRSTNTIACASYRRDVHAKRMIIDAGIVKIQGGVSDDSSGGVPASGADRRAPVPIECILPDRSVCTNLVVVTAPSMTKLAWATCRMEPCMAQMGFAAAHIASRAYAGNGVVQDVDYAGLRTEMLANAGGYVRGPLLPQVN